MQRLSTILAGCAVIASCGNPAPAPDAKAEAVELEDIYVAFRDEPVAAVRRFGDGVFDITGPIDSIELSGGFGELFLTGPSRTVAAVHFADAEGAQDALATLHKGEWVTVRCVSAEPLGQTMFDLNRCGPPRRAPDPGKRF